jgi:flagellar basal body-associated protein FliL
MDAEQTMSESSSKGRVVGILRVSAAVIAVLTVVVALAFIAFAGPVPHASSHLTAAGGSTEQWAFGGSASGYYSCGPKNCFGNATVNGSLTLSYQYYIEWVVIFTQTNVSASQTMIETQAALNASAKLSLSSCISNGTAPCQTLSASLNLAGKESATGFTNLTSGTVNETVPAVGSTPALAIKNAASNEAFNFSGSYSFSNGTVSASASFDFGANEQSSVTFPTPLGIVPLNPLPGDMWGSSAPFSASGSWTSGYTISGTSIYGNSATESNWTSGTVSPSGTLFVNGTDLGQYTLTDNYTNPPTQVTAQLIALDFNNGTFEASDGWVLIPFGIYGGVLYGILGTGLATAHGVSGPIAQAEPQVHPGASIISTPTGESAYYEKGTGFVGAGVSASTGAFGGTTGPTIHLTAGPEPVSVAQSQYGAVTSSGGSSSSSGFPILDIVLIVVVVVLVAVVAIVLMTRRARQRRSATPTMAAPGTVPPPPSTSSGPAPPMMMPQASAAAPAPAAMPAAPPPPPPAPRAPATPICPRCGQPSTYIAQYNRYYCYTDKQYL